MMISNVIITANDYSNFSLHNADVNLRKKGA